MKHCWQTNFNSLQCLFIPCLIENLNNRSVYFSPPTGINLNTKTSINSQYFLFSLPTRTHKCGYVPTMYLGGNM